MRQAVVTPSGARLRWVELPGTDPVRVYVHGLGAMASAYYARVAADPSLAGHRSLLIDMLGFGLSDRPADFDYSLKSHADALAEALRVAGVARADVVAHSMGGAVAIVLAERHPELVGRLVVAEPNLDPTVAVRKPGSSGIATYSEADFLDGGFAETLDRVDPDWAVTMRLADPLALHRSAVRLAAATVRETLNGLAAPRTLLYGERGEAPGREEELTEAGVRVREIPGAGHNVMLDQPEAFVRAVAEALTQPPGTGESCS
ncbi:alpha/beta hydrolase [Streptomyces sp. J2-1]|uniref:alpha/beta fold hydrolase n=1 Tax=Streptomyces corallincola TaxID=2851888 RepID=UPI001C3818C2|nr:alpha/beta hydrolase [Streptomyces corallincola]MBV2353714.1 alpha/beta hydrolase [Streptomyces corallincola]